MTPAQQKEKQEADRLSGVPAYGFNDAEGVYCSFCDWRHMCLSMEEMEAHLKRHLDEAHQRRLVFRTRNDDGHLTRIP